jgi:hypothetical protein
MSVRVTGIGDTVLFQVNCKHFHIAGLDLSALAEEVLKNFSFQGRLSNDRTVAGAQYEDAYFEYGEQTNKLIGAVSAVAESMQMEIVDRVWTQVHHPYESCNLHDHLGGPDMGFVFYVKVPVGAGKLYFDFGPAGTSTIEPIESMLVAFPAYLKHGVTKNLSDELRISIAGNLRKKQ